MTFLLFLGLAVISASLASPVSQPLPTAIIDSGAIVGTTTSFPSSTAIVRKYLGVPFAAPPVRFSPPEPVERWSTFYNATQWGPSCIQQIGQSGKELFGMLDLPPPANGESEDCLNLNVFTPESASAGSKAVLVWFYGGSYLNGATSVNLYDGASFAANQDVVVVTVNYRTNFFGFPGGDVPATERNLGFLDQRLALDWVQRNIAGLGGDPFKVTIFGESAGGGSVDALITAPPDPAPFHAAIMQSGQSSISMPLGGGPEKYAESWKKLAEFANCPSDNALECLRKAPALELKHFAENASLSFGPVPDGGVTLSATPRLDRLHSSEGNSSIARVPILIGNNADEPKPYIRGVNDTKAYLETLGLGEYVDMILKAYPLGQPGTHNENDRLSLIATDLLMTCPSKVFAEDSAKVGILSYRYFFNASFPNNEAFPGSGAFHAAEIAFVFGTYSKENATQFEHEVSQAMQKAWADFAKDPSHGPGWDQDPIIGVFGDGVKAGMSDEGKKPLNVVDSAAMDRRCELYRPLYDQLLLSGSS
ncbi:carboxylesterase hlo [Aspergillus nomiae NRRL 13137]|uniref:Carboxylesterase hlo n=1 Tax=Aspergillus nomiae NRRL (strain ATCC 15546 / NRRL 13137 / CBS 260.88 / M93) TaxID=1509407 RepID=A0A0L1IM87_ASPN3|nr:carboxylesterase hlo [Aspergillus nomiae NRRL 13137]KNG80689.1 carboxylesterase hlo [Aspergillus nomiae NRRL 13137]